MGNVNFYVEFPTCHWYFNPLLNATMLIARVVMRVYIFHDRHFSSSIISPFFCPHDPFDDITLAVVHPLFIPLCTRRMRRQIQVHTWHWPTPQSQIPQSLLTRFWSSWLRSHLLLQRVECPAWDVGIIRARVVPHAYGCAWGGRCGDDVGGSGKNFVPY